MLRKLSHMEVMEVSPTAYETSPTALRISTTPSLQGSNNLDRSHSPIVSMNEEDVVGNIPLPLTQGTLTTSNDEERTPLSISLLYNFSDLPSHLQVKLFFLIIDTKHFIFKLNREI